MLKEYALIMVIAGVAVACQTIPTAGPTNQGLQLPYEGSVSADGRAFTVINTGKGDAVAGSTSGESSAGVNGRANNSGDVVNYGGHFVSKGWKGSAVYGEADNVLGTNYGGYFVASGLAGTGVYGEATNAGPFEFLPPARFGGRFKAEVDNGTGVAGFGTSGAGVDGHATSGVGVHGESIGGTGGSFKTHALSGAAVSGRASNTGGDANNIGGWFVALGGHGIGIRAEGNTAAVFRGNVQIVSRDTGEVIIELGAGLDYAEGFNVVDKENAETGMVLVIDSENPGRLAISREPYDKRVAGIVSGARGVGSAVRVASERFDHPVALAGRVYCNVDATDEAVVAGDLLTTSSVPGFAMKAIDLQRAPGAILGKAMESLEKGKKGQILVLVTLQ